MIAIELEKVSKKYGSWKVLESLDLQVKHGEFVAIIGPSGAGKTTLLNLIAGIDRPDEGRITVMGKNITKMSESELAKFRRNYIGFVFQFFYLIPELTVVENIEIALDLVRKPENKNAVYERWTGVSRIKVKTYKEVLDLLAMVGFDSKYYNKFPDQLSGGERQRVAIARALANNPPIILADEPTGNLDAENAKIISEIFERINRDFNKTLVIATHDKQLIKLADKKYELKNGRLYEL
ncbi:MAG: ABC transporter ATP-binding protein [Candidatus Njordarchaeales archaeon]